ncbi:hypothetical protein B0T26DRAFT_678192 [Lasiosphaeria miniovina]|uniref:Uncharacterized protein n=1 Tax=Lasiosphaeria miniovina TaxID=1954250 RepID=A0AA40DUR0_9PEZI|nr:uncharacterized protein B0T26DRAFT_678192 [Lasiosphaeria miniovina]KAK0713916.1 hypothetical protein B0T26DRAFT_678192 [Lasiosphaeria miniovina]
MKLSASLFWCLVAGAVAAPALAPSNTLDKRETATTAEGWPLPHYEWTCLCRRKVLAPEIKMCTDVKCESVGVDMGGVRGLEMHACTNPDPPPRDPNNLYNPFEEKGWRDHLKNKDGFLLDKFGGRQHS